MAQILSEKRRKELSDSAKRKWNEIKSRVIEGTTVYQKDWKGGKEDVNKRKTKRSN